MTKLHAIRPAVEQDAPSLGRVHVAAWLETYGDILPREVLADLSIEGRTAMWHHILASPAARVFVAQRDSDVVGFGACGAQREEGLAGAGFDAEIYAIYVLRSSQDLGIGTALMRAMISTLAEDGFRAASLWVIRDNTPARRFYERQGGLVIGEREDPHGAQIEVAYGWPDLSRFAQQ